MELNNQDEEKPKPIYLFISQNCTHCHELIQLIQQKPELAKRVQGVPVESSPKLPPGLTKVPGLYIDGKIVMGTDCFDWVNKYGEIESSPSFSSAGGFEASGFSYLGSESDSGPSGVGSYSFLGDDDGSNGLDKKQIDSMLQQEQGGGSKSNSGGGGGMDMDAIVNQRMRDVGQTRRMGV